MITFLQTRERKGEDSILSLSPGTKKELPLYGSDEKYLVDKFLNAKVEKQYAQVPSGFDIETSSFNLNTDDGSMKCATMYIFQFAFKFDDEIVFIYGRTWDEWSRTIYLLRKISRAIRGKIIIYVHNLAYEFHWIWDKIRLNKVFCRKKRHPIYVQSDEILFKCSYFLSNYSLANLAKERGYTDKEHMTYKLIRHSETVLTKDELSYSLTDVRILCEYISDEVKKNGNIKDIPLTSTGYARRYCIEYIKEHTNWLSYKNFIKQIAPSDPDLFTALFQAYTGAFTHSNYKHTEVLLYDLDCFDYSSSYPGVMCRKRFPMKFREASPEHFQLLKGRAMVMTITFYCLRAKTNHSITSFNRNERGIRGGYKVDNGRLRCCCELTTTITDLDFENMELFYEWHHYKIRKLYTASYEYLPKELIMSILELYKNKTTLKGVVGKEEPYLRSKELINSVYGMAVTNPLNDEIIFEWGEWIKESVDIEDGLNKYVNGANLFLAYQWGVWVTAWARWELLHTVSDIGDDVVYCDTDSIKCLGHHDDIIAKHNERIKRENSKLSHYYNIPDEYFNPKTIKGKTKTLGIWDKEESLKFFKTLGAKRYCFSYYDDYYAEMIDDYFNSIKHTIDEKDYEYAKANFFITVAGLGKMRGKISILRLADEQNVSPYDIFTYEKDLTISAEDSGKQCFSYSKPGEKFDCMLTDYLGKTARVSETTFINSSDIEFNFNVTTDYAALLGIITEETNMGGEFDTFRLLRTGKENDYGD